MRPQRTAGKLSRNIPPITKYPTLFAGRNSHVAVVVTQRGTTAEEAEANADFIVKAWNCHDDLVAALKGFLPPPMVGLGMDPHRYEVAVRRAREVLAQAGSP